jgi:hypothetical protein
LEGSAATYENTDLPDLRGATAAGILSDLIDGCQRMSGLTADAISSRTPVEILEGQVYPQQNSVPDRKARVYVIAYLNEN